MKNLSKNVEFLKLQERQPALSQWFTEFSSLCSPSIKQELTWDLLGNGLMIEAADKDAYLDFLKWAAGITGAAFMEVSLSKIKSIKNSIGKTKKPAIIFIESGGWLESDNPSEEEATSRQLIVEALDMINGTSKVITSTCISFGEVAEVFRYKNKFDRHILWTTPRPVLHARDFIDQLGANIVSNELLNEEHRLGCILCLDFPGKRRFGMLEKTLKRLAFREKRKIVLQDVLEVAINGTGEGISCQEYPNSDQIAAHEAGHAVVAMIESDFENIPDWVSIIPSKDTAGVMVQDYSHIYSKDLFRSFSQVRTSIRIDLAGRVAEELILGEDNVGSDCANSDLRAASGRAFNLVARNGFSSSYGTNPYDGENLLVVIKGYFEADSEDYRIEAKKFIQMQYRAVKLILTQNKELLLAIKGELLTKRLLLKSDLARLADELTNPQKIAA
jgi:ATP-dependent Zn protease